MRWSHGLFFEAHERLEAMWRQGSGEHRAALKGLIQTAGVFVHLEQGRTSSADRLSEKARELLEKHGHLLAGNMADTSAVQMAPDTGALIHLSFLPKGGEMSFTPRTLGRTGIEAGALGVASSYRAPARAFEEAFERGCNYFYWGSFRTRGMRDAIRNICGAGRRDELIIVVQSYSRAPLLMELFFRKALRDLGIDRADILLLGWYGRFPAPGIIDKAMAMRSNGLFRFLAISSHNRSLFPRLADQGIYDLFHVRYNAAHRGAERKVFPYLTSLPVDQEPGIVTYTATRWGHLLDPDRMPRGHEPPSASDCYRFVLSNPAVDVCMCGPRDLSQMRDALVALSLGPMSPDELDRMRKIGDHVHGCSRKFV